MPATEEILNFRSDMAFGPDLRVRVSVLVELFWKRLDGMPTVDPGVSCAPQITHSGVGEGGQDFAIAELSAGFHY